MEIGKDSVDAEGCVGQLKLSHSRRVENDTAAGDQVQLAPRGCVATLCIVFSYRLSGDCIASGQGIREGRVGILS